MSLFGRKESLLAKLMLPIFSGLETPFLSTLHIELFGGQPGVSSIAVIPLQTLMKKSKPVIEEATS